VRSSTRKLSAARRPAASASNAKPMFESVSVPGGTPAGGAVKSTGEVRVKVTYVVDEYLALNVNT